MIVRQNDKIESARVAHLIKKVESMDATYVDLESNIIAQKQPFLISLLLGYRNELKESELEEMMRIIFLIWEYFKDFKQIGESKISADQFERIRLRNIKMLAYYEGEQNDNDKLALTGSDINHLKSKALITGVLFLMNHKKPLSAMKSGQKGTLFLDMKCLVECLDEITKT